MYLVALTVSINDSVLKITYPQSDSSINGDSKWEEYRYCAQCNTKIALDGLCPKFCLALTLVSRVRTPNSIPPPSREITIFCRGFTIFI